MVWKLSSVKGVTHSCCMCTAEDMRSILGEAPLTRLGLAGGAGGLAPAWGLSHAVSSRVAFFWQLQV